MNWIMIYIDTIAMEVDRLISWRLLMDKGCLRPFFNYLQKYIKAGSEMWICTKKWKKKRKRKIRFIIWTQKKNRSFN